MTDLRPGYEVLSVDVRLQDPASVDPPRSTTEHFAREADLYHPARIAEFPDVRQGEYMLVVALIGPGEQLITQRLVSIEVDAGPVLGVTVVITSSCRGIECPGVGDLENATTCRSGVCVPPTCTSESMVGCAPVCIDDPDCASTSCGDGRCIFGACVFETDDLACDAGQVCLAEGCALCDAMGCHTVDWQPGAWSACSETCGEGVETRAVACVGIDGAPVDEALCTRVRPTTEQPCDAGTDDCGWSAWGAFDACSASCDGMHTRTRTCEVPGHCAGSETETTSCDRIGCCSRIGTCTAWELQRCCNRDTGRRCEIRYCVDGSCVRQVGSCRTDCPCSI